MTAVAESGERFVVRGQDVCEAVCELADKVGMELTREEAREEGQAYLLAEQAFSDSVGGKGKEGRKEGLSPVSRGSKPVATLVRPAGEETVRTTCRGRRIGHAELDELRSGRPGR